ncbi:polyamine aminopropyltransferase [Oscillatoria sp. FACHB-1407]|uniref:polyamine aminopropyltransferase n=1 Tax=Oscillatoria sp. FACHB-1407 TaxID=2692847 RepID=UPI002814C190|nr:polyamine aminopropyltransferase [Oscillatoria sp. FACHB-1407]
MLESDGFPNKRRERNLLLIAAAISSACGLAVELLLGTLASYLVGNQALAYGVAVGGFLAAMGIGAYLSRFIAVETGHADQYHRLQVAFVQVELWIAPLSAVLPLALFALFVVDGPFWMGLFLATILLGILAGMEVPLLTRLLELDEGVREALAGVLALDYLGALLGSLLFPIALLPFLGLFPSAALIGALPAFVVFIFGRVVPRLRYWGRWGLAIAIALCVFAPLTLPLSDRLENSLYDAPVITRIQSTYQRIVMTRQGTDVRLFLDGDLQFSTLDEYRYHEALVHPAMSINQREIEQSSSSGDRSRQVLLMGAGDGLALREVLKWQDVERVLLIDLDPAIVNLARRHPFLVNANAKAFADPRVEVRHADAFTALAALHETFDVIIADFPDPDRDGIAKLYTQGFYRRMLAHLNPTGIFVTQASSPFFAPRAFACIAATLESLPLVIRPYTIDVPSFGPWGFVLATQNPIETTSLPLPVATHFLTVAMLPSLFQLPGDIQLGGVEVNRLSHPVILRYQNDPRWEAYD